MDRSLLKPIDKTHIEKHEILPISNRLERSKLYSDVSTSISIVTINETTYRKSMVLIHTNFIAFKFISN